jgi:hypothetical protein
MPERYRPTDLGVVSLAKSHRSDCGSVRWFAYVTQAALRELDVDVGDTISALPVEGSAFRLVADTPPERIMERHVYDSTPSRPTTSPALVLADPILRSLEPVVGARLRYEYADHGVVARLEVSDAE